MYLGVSKVLLPLYLSDCISVTLYHRYRTASVARTKVKAIFLFWVISMAAAATTFHIVIIQTSRCAISWLNVVFRFLSFFIRITLVKNLFQCSTEEGESPLRLLTTTNSTPRTSPRSWYIVYFVAFGGDTLEPWLSYRLSIDRALISLDQKKLSDIYYDVHVS